MLAVALIIGQMTAGLRYQARIASYREERARSLYEFARDLSSLLETQLVVDTAATLHRPDLPGGRGRAGPGRPRAGLPCAAMAARRSPWTSAPRSGRTTRRSPRVWAPIRLPAARSSICHCAHRCARVACWRSSPRIAGVLLVPEQKRQLDTFAALAAIALERVHYVEVAQQALIQMESERLRNSLLSALSHDLRTPLAALVGLAESLAMTTPAPSGTQLETAQAIAEEARRMNALVNNLLDMARIQSGEVKLRRQWLPFEEVVGSALKSAQSALGPPPGGGRTRPGSAAGRARCRRSSSAFSTTFSRMPESTRPTGRSSVSPPKSPATDLLVAISDNGPGLPKGQEEVHLREIRPRRARVVDARRRARARDQSRDRRRASGKDLGREQSGGWRPLLLHAAAGHTPAAPREEGPSERSVVVTGTPMTPTPPVALLVEDERQIRRFVRTAMEAEGWHVVEADTLKQGLIDAGTRKPDLVILDLGLPDGNGIEFIHAIPRLVIGPRDRAVGAGRRDRQDRGARRRRRRLSDQAFRRRRAARPRPRDAAPADVGIDGRATACSGSATWRSTRPIGWSARRAPSCT